MTTKSRPYPPWVSFALLVAALMVPAIGGLFGVPDANVQDPSSLSRWPNWSAVPVREWPADFENWYKDHYPLRGWFVRLNALVQRRWLETPSSTVLIGRDGWLFYTGENTVDDLLGRDRLSDAELAAWRESLEARSAWWHRHGASYLFVLVPNKSTLYPEYLPTPYRNQLRRGKLDQLLGYLAAHPTTVPLLDLRPSLFAAKRQEQVFWQTDSHWSGFGLAAACDAIMRKVRDLGALYGPTDVSSWGHIVESPREGDCIRVLRARGAWPIETAAQFRVTFPPDFRRATTTLGPTNQPVAYERDSGRGTTVLLCDSFFRLGGLPIDAQTQVPLMLQFHRFVSLWTWSGTTDRADFPLCEEIAAKEKPTLVIEECTERFLHTAPPDTARFENDRPLSTQVRRKS